MSTKTLQIDFGKNKPLWEEWKYHFGEQHRSQKAFGIYGAKRCKWIIEYFNKYDYQKDAFGNKEMSDEERILEMVHTFLIFTCNGPKGEPLFETKEQIQQGLMLIGYGSAYMLENGYGAKDIYWHLCSSQQLFRKSRSATLELLLCYLNVLGIGRDKFGEPVSDDIDDIRGEISDALKNG